MPRVLLVTLIVAAMAVFVWGLTFQEFTEMIAKCAARYPDATDPWPGFPWNVTIHNMNLLCCVLMEAGMMTADYTFAMPVVEGELRQEWMRLQAGNITVDIEGWIGGSRQCVYICSEKRIPNLCHCFWHCVNGALVKNSIVPAVGSA